MTPRARPPIARSDLSEALALAEDDLRALSGARLFCTGATGFYGTWLLELLGHAIARLNLSLDVVVLSRDPARFAHARPHLGGLGWLTVHPGDVRNFASPAGAFSHVFHAATSTHGPRVAPKETAAVIVEGTQRTLQFCDALGAPRLLYASSGAVYGQQPEPLSHLPEDFVGALDWAAAQNVYATSKRTAELLCRLHQPQTVIARGFAFVGAHLPLDEHFAIGNFILDGLSGRRITLQSDGTPRRSYLYASDLAVWLVAMLARAPEGQTYNLGSDEDFTLREVAERVGALFHVPVAVAGAPQTGPRHRYVPSIRKARHELGLSPTVDLDSAIIRTARWWRDASERLSP